MYQQYSSFFIFLEKRNNNYFYDHNAQITPEAFYFQNQILLLMNQEMQAISETSNAIDKTFVQMKFLQKEINKTKFFYLFCFFSLLIFTFF